MEELIDLKGKRLYLHQKLLIEYEKGVSGEDIGEIQLSNKINEIFDKFTQIRKKKINRDEIQNQLMFVDEAG